ncbi:MAG: response regulator transcription factor [Thermohalobaculum sp.]|nr:response regulator transcription factor [Thermohalobaculum sp.]
MSMPSIGIIFHDRLFVDTMAAALDGGQFQLAWTQRDTPEDGGVPSAQPCDILLVQAPIRAEQMDAVVGRLTPSGERTRVAVLTMAGEDDATLALARDCGADAFLSSDMSLEAFLECLRLVALGVQVFPANASRKPRAHHNGGAAQTPHGPPNGVNGHASEPTLSNREIEIAAALRDGHSNKIIARKLDITESTVKTHLKAILRKIGAQNRTQVAIWAVENDL